MGRDDSIIAAEPRCGNAGTHSTGEVPPVRCEPRDFRCGGLPSGKACPRRHQLRVFARRSDEVSEQFKGTISVDIRDSVPDWAPFEPPKAPDGAPSVVYIVLDDVGFSAMSCYGGPIETPTIERIAADGIRYTQWHTTALCSPTRSCLLTGRNHTRNSMACIT